MSSIVGTGAVTGLAIMVSQSFIPMNRDDGVSTALYVAQNTNDKSSKKIDMVTADFIQI
jgi:hypothetical protein